MERRTFLKLFAAIPAAAVLSGTKTDIFVLDNKLLSESSGPVLFDIGTMVEEWSQRIDLPGMPWMAYFRVRVMDVYYDFVDLYDIREVHHSISTESIKDMARKKAIEAFQMTIAKDFPK